MSDQKPEKVVKKSIEEKTNLLDEKINPLDELKSSLRKHPTRPYVGGAAVIIWDEKILLMKRKYDPDANMWSIPWGHQLAGESSRECALRIVSEKTNIKVRISDKVGFVEHVDYDENDKPLFHYILICYNAVIIDERFKDGIMPMIETKFSKTIDLKFVPIKELKEFEVCKSTREILSKPLVPL